MKDSIYLIMKDGQDKIIYEIGSESKTDDICLQFYRFMVSIGHHPRNVIVGMQDVIDSETTNQYEPIPPILE
jgi:hypothetical protein